IILLFNKSGLTLENFANILEISIRWLKDIKSSNYIFDIESIKKASEFFNISFKKITTEKIHVPEDLRIILQKRHAKNVEYNKILSDPPSVPFIIDNILVKDDEFIFSDGMELKFVKKIILRYYPGLKLTNLSNDLQKSASIKYWKHPTKKNTNLYRAKK